MKPLHLICERDVGLFSLLQQVISNAAWAEAAGRVPVVRFGERTCYHTPRGFAGATTVWEYYFEPLVPGFGVAAIPPATEEWIRGRFPGAQEPGGFAPEGHWVTAHFGDHPEIGAEALPIPFLEEDPPAEIRERAARILEKYVRPRRYVREKLDVFWQTLPAGQPVLGVHLRGTDAISAAEVRPHRQGSLRLDRYRQAVEEALEQSPEAAIFVATDDEASLLFMQREFGERVHACPSIRHQGGEAAGVGPTGWIMPAYIAGDRDVAAQNGLEAIVEYLALTRCDHLIHNGGSLARTVLLARPELPHTNTHRPRAVCFAG